MVVKRSNDELYHHGVKGQRWGVRRYQNPDGTLTELGRKRFGSEKRFSRIQANQEKEFKKKGWMDVHNTATKYTDYDSVNKKYKDDDFSKGYATERGIKYLQDIVKAEDSAYKKALKEVVNTKYDALGEEYLKYSGINEKNILRVSGTREMLDEAKAEYERNKKG